MGGNTTGPALDGGTRYAHLRGGFGTEGVLDV